MSEANEVKADEAGRAAGPVQQLVAPAAERSGPELLPVEGSAAVAPGEARRLLLKWETAAARMRATIAAGEWPYDLPSERVHAEAWAAVWEECADDFRVAIGLPVAEAGQRSLRSERSGRRNAQAD